MPHPWKRSRPGWMGPWAPWSSTWSGGQPPCLQEGGVGTRWSFRSLPTQAILWFCNFIKRPLSSSTAIVNPSPPRSLNHVPQCHTYMFLEHFHHFLGQSVPIPHHSKKNVFWIPNLNLHWQNLRSLLLIQSLVTWEKKLTPTLLQPPLREL